MVVMHNDDRDGGVSPIHQGWLEKVLETEPDPASVQLIHTPARSNAWMNRCGAVGGTRMGFMRPTCPKCREAYDAASERAASRRRGSR